MKEIEIALEKHFSLHDSSYMMDLLYKYRSVEVNYEDDEDGF